MYCPNCGEEVDNPQNYCMKCGTKLDSEGNIKSSGVDKSSEIESDTIEDDIDTQTSSRVKTSRGSRRQRPSKNRSGSSQKRGNRTRGESSNYDSKYNWFKYCKIVTPISVLLIFIPVGTFVFNSYVPGRGYSFVLGFASLSPAHLLMYSLGGLLALAGIVLMTIDIYEMRRNNIWDRSPWTWLIAGMFLSFFVLIYYIYVRRQYEM